MTTEEQDQPADTYQINGVINHRFKGNSDASRSTIFPDYQRVKSQSVKLTHIQQNDSSPKKAVRFADDFGLDLSQIKMIETDDLPCIPSTAFKHLHISNDKSSFTLFNHEHITILKPLFENPIYTPGFNDRVSTYKIVLEQASMSI
jgi:hypothetical protein